VFLLALLKNYTSRYRSGRTQISVLSPSIHVVTPADFMNGVESLKNLLFDIYLLINKMENIYLRIILNKAIENERECYMNTTTMISNSKYCL
jgi:hypothetical protein